MGDAALKVSLAASGQSSHVEGKVSITATELFARYYLPPIIAELQAVAPGIFVQVITSNDVRDLTRREADISIRHARPEQPDLIGRLVAETTAHLYASRGYLDRIGRPGGLDDLADIDLLSFDEAENIVPFLQGLGMPVTRDNMRASTASGGLLMELTRAGLGATFLTKEAADRFSDLEQVLPSMAPVPVPVWLVTHRELRTSRRIRLVYDLSLIHIWRFHAAHHSVKRLYWLNGIRSHPVEVVMQVFFYALPFALLQPSPEIAMVAILMQLCIGVFQHGNMDLKLRFWEYIFSIGDNHRYHHYPNKEVGDSNYGGEFIVWDILFGTFHNPANERPSDNIGIGTAPNYPMTVAGRCV